MIDSIACMTLARFDASPCVRKIWRQVWDEATSGSMSATLRMFWPEMLTGILTSLDGNSWRLKLSAAKVITEVFIIYSSHFPCSHSSINQIAKVPFGVDPITQDRAKLEGAIMGALRGRIFPGKYNILEALSACLKVWLANPQPQVDGVLAALLTECKKKDVAYRTHALQVCFIRLSQIVLVLTGGHPFISVGSVFLHALAVSPSLSMRTSHGN